MRALEEARTILFGNGDREGAKPLPMLDIVVQVLLHVGSPGRCQQTPVSQGSWTEFGCSLEPADDLSTLQELDGSIQPALLGVLVRVAGLGVAQYVHNLVSAVSRSPVNMGDLLPARHLHEGMPHQKTCTHRAACISPSRRHEDLVDAKLLL